MKEKAGDEGRVFFAAARPRKHPARWEWRWTDAVGRRHWGTAPSADAAGEALRQCIASDGALASHRAGETPLDQASRDALLAALPPTPARRWWEQAACHGHMMAPDAWHEDPPMHNPDRAAERRRAVIAVCTGCAVRLDCLRDALNDEAASADLRRGIRGGLLPIQRAELDRRGSAT